MKLVPLLSACVFGAVAFQAVAEPVSGTTAGKWFNALPSGSPIVTTGSGTPLFTYGDGADFGTGPNKLTFAALVGSFSSATETPFKVGTITYFNGTTAVGTTPDSVQLGLTLNFAAPPLGPVTSNYTFDLVSTINTSDPDASADYVYLPSAFSATSFLIGSATYNVKLNGFSNVVGDGFLTSDALSFPRARRQNGIAICTLS